MVSKPKVLVIVGSTASGKTSLAIEIAKQYNGEIISADSRQVYRGLNIGTAKVTESEMQGIPHHCIDVADVHEIYTAKDFVYDGETAISDITNRGRLPIIAGGTFFYVDLLLGRVNMPEVPPNHAFRVELEAMSAAELFAELRERDNARAATIDPNNKRRLIRALEIIAAIGRVPDIPTEEHYNTLWLGIKLSREDIRDRLKIRAYEWLTGGFEQEIAWLLKQDLTPERIAEFGFEYAVGIAWYRGELTNEEFIEQITAKNWQYAKRQLQWLKKNERINWLTPNALDTALAMVTNWFQG